MYDGDNDRKLTQECQNDGITTLHCICPGHLQAGGGDKKPLRIVHYELNILCTICAYSCSFVI